MRPVLSRNAGASGKRRAASATRAGMVEEVEGMGTVTNQGFELMGGTTERPRMFRA